MENKILEFDEKIVDRSEIIENVKFYITKSENGLKLLSNGENEAALNLLKELNEMLKLESNYYKKTKIQHVIFVNKDYNDYSEAIHRGFSKQLNRDSYDMLASNLGEIANSMKMYCGYLIN